MAAPHEQPWSNFEKNYLLAEIIKAHNPSPRVLMNVIVGLRPQTPWDDIPLPPGRHLNASRRMFDQIYAQQIGGSFEGPLGYPSPAPFPPPPSTKRPFPFEQAYPGTREIRPKPSSMSNIESQMSPAEQPPRKKRGRPTKAEVQARVEAQTGQSAGAAQGPTPSSEVSIPSTPIPAAPATPATPEAVPPLPFKTERTSEQSPVPQSLRNVASVPEPTFAPPPQAPLPLQPQGQEIRPSLPPMTRVSISSIVTPTGPKSGSQSSSSSGKKKRGRLSRSDVGDPVEESSGSQRNVASESPYTGTIGEPPDTPARAAAQRRRNGRGEEIQPPEWQEAFAQHPPGTQPTTK